MRSRAGVSSQNEAAPRSKNPSQSEELGRTSLLHAQALHSRRFNEAENHVLHEKANQNDGKQASKDLGDVEQILAFENVPTQSALAGGGAEHQLCCD